MEDKRFVHLRVRTEYSLLNSLVSISDIVSYAREKKPLAIGVMDDFNISSAFAFSSKISAESVKPILGLNMCISLGENEKWTKNIRDRSMCIGFLAMNYQGYKNLIQLVKKSQFDNKRAIDGALQVTMEDIREFSEGIICLSGGYNGILAAQFLHNSEQSAIDQARVLKDIFDDRLYIELTRHGRTDEQKIEDFLIKIAMELNIPLVATNDVHFFTKNQYIAHDAICCIRDQKFVSEDDRWKVNEEYYLKSETEMIDLFEDIPEAIESTITIAKRCSFMLEKNKPMLPSFANGIEEEIFIQFAHEGLEKRKKQYPKDFIGREQTYKERLEYEIKMIKQMGFIGYFLIVCDFIKWAKSNKIPVGPGRGSGAGSIVAWCLEITNVDPIKYGLIFERFLNPERVSMPDFDIDFCQSRRDEVINYVRNKYGNDKVASIITFGTLQAKAALKDIGRVLQIPYGVIDNICKLIPFNPIEPVTLSKALSIDDRLRLESMKDDDIKELIEIALEVEGAYRHSSTHAAGIVISRVPMTDIIPIHKDNTTDLPVTGFSMKDVESVGLVKFDFLGLKTLTVIAETINMVKERHNIELDLDTVDTQDKKTLDLLHSGKTKGIFQMEATVPREALQKIEVNGIPDISAITSLNRPGPMENIPSYINRKNGKELIVYPHELSKALLEETYGIIVYQEQVITFAQVVAGYSAGGADLLRRAMGKKIKAEMDQQRSIFVEGAIKNNVLRDEAERLFEIIEKFAGYGFNKSHSIAYSIISYQTAYLKAHYPAEFFSANLNLDMYNTEKIVEIVSDARVSGIEVLLPNINESIDKFTAKSDTEIVYGLGALKSIGVSAMQAVVNIRKKEGNFDDIFDFITKCGSFINKRSLENLIQAGCFDTLHENRLQLKNSLDILIKYSADINTVSKKDEKQNSLFDVSEMKTTIIKPQLVHTESCTNTDIVTMEFDAFGFYISVNPLLKYEEKLKEYGVVESTVLESILPQSGSKDILMAGVITKVRQRVGKKGRFAFLTVADISGMMEYAIFNDTIITQKRDLMEEGRVLLFSVTARVDESVGVRLNVNDMFDAGETLYNNNKMNEIFARIASRALRSSYSAMKKTDKVVLQNQNDATVLEENLKPSKRIQFFNKGYIIALISNQSTMDLAMKIIKDNRSDQEKKYRVIIDNGIKKISLNQTVSQTAIEKIQNELNVTII